MKPEYFAQTLQWLADDWAQKSAEPGILWYLWHTPIPHPQLAISSAAPDLPGDWSLVTGDPLTHSRNAVLVQIWLETKGLSLFDTGTPGKYQNCPYCRDQMYWSRGRWVCRDGITCGYTDPRG